MLPGKRDFVNCLDRSFRWYYCLPLQTVPRSKDGGPERHPGGGRNSGPLNFNLLVAVTSDSSRAQNSLSESVTFGSTREVTKTISMGRRQGLMAALAAFLGSSVRLIVRAFLLLLFSLIPDLNEGCIRT